jgi:hypothetical protein
MDLIYHGKSSWFCNMVNSFETNSTKSSISGRATSLKKSAQKGVKAIAWPFKKLKKSISTASISSIHSCTTGSISNNKDVDCGNKPSADSQNDGDGIEPEVEMTPREELRMLFNNNLVIYTSKICIRGTPGALALTHLHLLQIQCRFPGPWWPALSFLPLCCSQM